MDITRTLGRLLPGTLEERHEDQYECSRCGETYQRPVTPCEECGSDVMVPLE